MGFFSKVGSFFSGLFGGSGGSGSRSSSSTTYEPDKVRVAEIEKDTKIQLANLENERIALMKQARLDILECETQSNIALEQARAQGLTVMAQTILAMQDKLNEVAEKRLLIIEKGSLQIIKEIESFYDEMGAKLQEDNDRYNSEKLPQLLSILERYEEGSPAHKLYYKRIEEDMKLQADYYKQQLDVIASRQSQIIDGFLSGKDKIIQQTGQITAGMLETIQKQALTLNERIEARDYGQKALAEKQQLTLTQNDQQE